MSYVSDDTLLTDIVIPGSHDSGTTKMMWAAKTQDKSIKEQMACGARYFDIRPQLKDGKLVGFDDRIKAMREKDPDSFRAEKPDPSFANPTGNGGPATLSRAAQAARAAAAKFGPVSTPAENTNTK